MTPNGASIRIPFMFFSKIIFAFVSFFLLKVPLSRGVAEGRGVVFVRLRQGYGETLNFQPSLRFGENSWWVVLDSNQRPLRCQRNALTN